MQEMESKITGFIDTLLIAQDLYPDRKGKGGYKQEALLKDILNESYSAHNALDDVQALQKLFSKMQESSIDIF